MEETKIKKNIFSITIGIPAFNEEANIFYLLDSLISQKEDGFLIERVLVISDGSTDGTEKKVKECKDPRIILISGKNRKGKPARLNQIFSEAQSDIVVILDADIKLASDDVIKKLVEPLIDGSSTMSVSGTATPLVVQNIIQKIAMAGVDIWDNVKMSKYSSPLYLSEGRIRAFVKKVYKEMIFPQASADEAFSFLYCAAKNYPFVFVKEALVYYNLPETLYDYIKQNKRFIKSKGIQECVYEKKFVDKYYTIGLKAKLIFLLNAMIKNPFWTLLYLGVMPFVRISFFLDKSGQEVLWEAITTSKTLKHESRRLKIVFSSYDSVGNPYYNGGGASAIHEVAKKLTYKYDVTVICGKYPLAKERVSDEVLYRYIGFNFLGPKIGQMIFQILLPYYAILDKYDIWIESFTPPFSVSFLTLFTKKPIIGLVHMLAGEDMSRKYKLPFHIIESIGIKKYHNFIVTTKESGEKIKKINSSAKIAIIPNGVDTDIANGQFAKKHFLFIGRIEMDQKGLDLLLSAYSMSAQEINFPLIIAGSGLKNEEKKLVKMIQEMGFSGKVKFLGRVSGHEKDKLFRGAAAVIVPSRFETFSLTALESLSYGVPVVSFDIEGLKWLPEDFSYKIKPFNAKVLADAMKELSGKNAVRKINTENLKIFLKDHNWNIIAGKYEKLIESIAGDKKEKNNIDSMIEEITRKKTLCIFISPHFDDAILSCGELLLKLASKTEIMLATVFTEAALPPYTYSAKVNLKICGGYKNAQDLFRLRKNEDINACKAIGAKHVHFGLQDALFRKKSRGSRLSELVGRFLPEMLHIYPIYRLNIISGKISKNDSGTSVLIEKKLKYFRKESENCMIFCPLGTGYHVDHIIVRKACRKVFSKIIFWEDYPYNSRSEKKMDLFPIASWGTQDTPELKEKKAEIISLYRSQIKSMFPGGIVLSPENYYYEKYETDNK